MPNFSKIGKKSKNWSFLNKKNTTVVKFPQLPQLSTTKSQLRILVFTGLNKESCEVVVKTPIQTGMSGINLKVFHRF